MPPQPSKKPELLAPAGDFEKLKVAIHYGADAVYFGSSSLSLRAMADNFSGTDLCKAIDYAHSKGIKAYVTANIFAHNADLTNVKEYAKLLSTCPPDAVIVSDPGVFLIFKDLAPQIPLHLSTQANVTNSYSARFWQSVGFSRLILARELSLAEIKEIRQAVSIELEVFVHGSMCISYSGRCYISSFLAHRSANRGKCVNACRWKFALVEEQRQGEYFPIFEDDRGTYVMSSRDLCMVNYIPLLCQAGIDSFKIEGRMKGINYIASAVKVYREAIDLYMSGDFKTNDRWLTELSMSSNRGFSTGMFFGSCNQADYNFDEAPYRATHSIVGIVLDVKDGFAQVSLRDKLLKGDSLEFILKSGKNVQLTVSELYCDEGDFLTRHEKSFKRYLEALGDSTTDSVSKILKELFGIKPIPINDAKNEDTVYINCPQGVSPCDIIRKRLS